MTVNDLIQVSSGGIKVATFNEIKSALIESYKTIYGKDIDVSSVSADGQYINMISTIFNNTLQALQTAYQNLNINNANGAFLDILANLSNVKRKDATYSEAYISVSNNTGSNINIDDDNPLTCLDINGNEWKSVGTYVITSEINNILMKCTTAGPISCLAGTIDRTLEYEQFEISQPENGSKGSYRETDEALKERLKFLGSISQSVTNSIISSIYQIPNIQECIIFDNKQDVSQSYYDGASVVAPHSLDIVLRLNRDYNFIDFNNFSTNIGRIIYNKLTPGINTTQAAVASQGGSYSVEEIDGVSNTVYWRYSQFIGTNISVYLRFITTPSTSILEEIKEKLTEAYNEYAKELSITDKITYISLYNVLSDKNVLKDYSCLLDKITFQDLNGQSAAVDLSIDYPLNLKYTGSYNGSYRSTSVSNQYEFIIKS